MPEMERRRGLGESTLASGSNAEQASGSLHRAKKQRLLARPDQTGLWSLLLKQKHGLRVPNNGLEPIVHHPCLNRCLALIAQRPFPARSNSS